MTMIPRCEHPRPDFARAHWLNLNGQWDFAFSEENVPPVFDRTITVPFSWASPLSGVAVDKKGTGWYHRTVRFAADGETWLVIGAADYDTVVYVNGHLMTRHTGGYGEIRVNVTPYWKQEEDNDLTIRVTDWDLDNQTRGKQGYGELRGIWQTVYLEDVPKTHLERFKIETKCDGSITVKTVIYAAEEAKTVLCAAFAGKQFSKEISLQKGSNEETLLFAVAEPKLWSCENPNLYEGTISVGSDTVSTYFGIREIGYRHFDGRKFPWITLNGKPVYLNGTLDQSFNPEGFFTLPSEEEIITEVRRMKAVGLNMARLHIKPEEPRKLYWMDKLGVMAFSDMVCYWGQPLPATQKQYEKELWEFLHRDCNHPCIITWVIFNETWGLFTNLTEAKQRYYAPETQEWVRRLYKQVKAFDGTRIVEDNSACNNDHVETDLNTWHFYKNGYMTVKEEIDSAAKKAFEGSAWNYINGNRMGDTPFMNSECGMVWGVEDSAGDSDLAWQYHYMLNEFRLHENLCGFVFTEFHDVVNEFNGYYRIDGRKKDFGYGELAGMELKDMHTPDFIAYDAAPCRTVGAGEEISTELYYSAFDGAERGTALTLEWVLYGMSGVYATGSRAFDAPGDGVTALGELTVAMLDRNDVCILTFILKQDERVLARNFCTFDVRGRRQGVSFVRPCGGKAAGFTRSWKAINQSKLCGAGAGSVSFVLPVEQLAADRDYELWFEASAKRLLAKDNNGMKPNDEGADYMHGYKLDPGTNHNSYFMTDETGYPSGLTVAVEGETVCTSCLPNDPADARGILSWQYQTRERYLDEAGSYGYLCRVPVSREQMERAKETGELHITLSCDKGGLALYGRNAGRYAIDVELVEKQK